MEFSDEEGVFFLKKEAKTFVNSGFVCTGLPAVNSGPFEQKFFASFFQKRCFLPSLQPIAFI